MFYVRMSGELQRMKITYDVEADSVYISLTTRKVERTMKVRKNPNILIDVDRKGKAIGIEVIGVLRKKLKS